MDEPDIYLHPDLQRKLVRIASDRFGQIFLATHSAEIINEVNVGDILSVSRRHRTARRITTDEQLKEVFKYIGSTENIEFARISKARRIVFFEGQDKKIFQRIARKINRNTFLDDPDTVFLQSGGFSQWRRVREVNWTLRTVFDLSVKIVSVFDRDFRCDQEIDSFLAMMNEESGHCFVLDRKEIENYLLSIDTVFRLVSSRLMGTNIDLKREAIVEIFADVMDELRDETESHSVSNYVAFHRQTRSSLDDSTLLRNGMRLFRERWRNFENRLRLVSGKRFLSGLFGEVQRRLGVSITIPALVDAMHVGEIPTSLRTLIAEIDQIYSDRR